MLDKKNIERLIKELILELDANPQREGLCETPRRVADMLEEMLCGAKYTNEQIAAMNNKCFAVESNDLVVLRDIECTSLCEHHIALIYDLKISVAYIPNGKVVGLSKIARVADMVCRRLQLQERIGSDINEIIRTITNSNDVAVVISGVHSCMSARGIKKHGAVTKTACLEGLFKTDADLRAELYGLLS